MEKISPQEKQRITVSIVIPLLFVCTLWLVYLTEYVTGLDFSWLGIYPRRLMGLIGIVFTPFLHGSFSHLVSNSIPLLILGGAMIYFYRTISYQVFLWLWLIDGIGVWLLGREAYHIGASGLVYGMATFLFFSGTLRKSRNLLALSLAVIFLYGSLIWGMFPYVPDISWEAHLFGFIAGIYFSIHYRNQGPPDDPLPEWMQEEESVEEDGNVTQDVTTDTEKDQLKIVYRYKPKDENIE